MSALYVGQRVRIVACNTPEMQIYVGTEDRIVGRCPVYRDHFDLESAASAAGRACSWAACHLEPIVDHGRKVVSWSDCLWQPEGIAA